MRRFWIVVFTTLLGYAGGALGGALLILTLSPRMRDPVMEAVLSGLFVFGPIAAVVATVGALWATKPDARLN